MASSGRVLLVVLRRLERAVEEDCCCGWEVESGWAVSGSVAIVVYFQNCSHKYYILIAVVDNKIALSLDAAASSSLPWQLYYWS